MSEADQLNMVLFKREPHRGSLGRMFAKQRDCQSLLISGQKTSPTTNSDDSNSHTTVVYRRTGEMYVLDQHRSVHRQRFQRVRRRLKQSVHLRLHWLLSVKTVRAQQKGQLDCNESS